MPEKMLRGSFSDINRKLKELAALFNFLAASEPAKEEKKAEAESEEFVFEPLAPNIAFDDFAKVDLRIGKILDCKKVEKSRKLLQLTIDIGEKEPRNIFSSLAGSEAALAALELSSKSC